MARQKCVLNAMLHQLDPTTVLTKFGAIASAGKEILSTSIPPSEIHTFVGLSLKARNLPVTTVSFVPPKIDTGDPDFTLIRQMVHDGDREVRGGRDQQGPGTSRQEARLARQQGQLPGELRRQRHVGPERQLLTVGCRHRAGRTGRAAQEGSAVSEEQHVVAVVVTWNRRELLVEALERDLGADPAARPVRRRRQRVHRRDRRPAAVRVPRRRAWSGRRRNTGGAGGFALGIRHALDAGPCDLLWLMDDDTVPEPTALGAPLAARPDRRRGGPRRRPWWPAGSSGPTGATTR